MDVIVGKTALITGGANGMGAAYVKRLFKAGLKACTIADTDECNAKKLVKEIDCCYGEGKAIFVNTDVTDEGAFECAFKQNMKKFKKLDLVVNNAGIMRDRTWKSMVDINVKGVVQGSLLGIKYMGRNNGFCGGTIVNCSSILGLAEMPGCPGYTGTKHFVVGFTRSMGTPLWFDMTGIRFMAVCPGVTLTSLITEAGQWVFEGFPGLGETHAKTLKGAPSQSPDDMAEGLNTVLNQGTNGSVWVGIGGKPVFEVAIPSIDDMKIPDCKG